MTAREQASEHTCNHHLCKTHTHGHAHTYTHTHWRNRRSFKSSLRVSREGFAEDRGEHIAGFSVVTEHVCRTRPKRKTTLTDCMNNLGTKWEASQTSESPPMTAASHDFRSSLIFFNAYYFHKFSPYSSKLRLDAKGLAESLTRGASASASGTRRWGRLQESGGAAWCRRFNPKRKACFCLFAALANFIWQDAQKSSGGDECAQARLQMINGAHG